MVNGSYWYKKYVCVYACCVTRTELLVRQAGKSSAYVIDIIWEELKRNNINFEKYLLSFYISKCFDGHEELYGAILIQTHPVIHEI